ncbi:hypothetical protein UUU_12850 [Klebsiella pneumoniae subsp. pneumoniae DSM 30104 = JCM 1662 = NBRC 14940]|nr:hypothetical protein UUU_12850 [Klebsiella pneumoniae subsp. pneumoniae DSM 30104 = JCM 1662 = NBRC 14940]
MSPPPVIRIKKCTSPLASIIRNNYPYLSRAISLFYGVIFLVHGKIKFIFILPCLLAPDGILSSPCRFPALRL